MKISAERRDYKRPKKTPFENYLNVLREGVITNRDLEVLQYIYRFRFLSLSQIKSLAFPSLKVAQRRMTRLYELQLVDRFRPWCSVGSKEYIYCIDHTGIFFVAAKLGKSVEGLGWRKRDNEVKLAYVNHFLKVAEVYIKLRRCVWIKNWQVEPELKSQHYNFRPDVYIEFSKSRIEYEWFVEVDLGTEWRQKIEKKIIDYERYFIVNKRCPTVVFIADKSERLMQLENWVDDKKKLNQIKYEYKTFEQLAM